jgi:ABC-type Fe3+ transport system permease subunit
MNSVARTAQRLQVLVVALLALFFAFPVLSMLAEFARPQDIIDTLTQSSLRGVWWFTLWQAVASTVLTLVVGLPFTWAISRHSFRFSRILTALITIRSSCPQSLSQQESKRFFLQQESRNFVGTRCLQYCNCCSHRRAAMVAA